MDLSLGDVPEGIGWMWLIGMSVVGVSYGEKISEDTFSFLLMLVLLFFFCFYTILIQSQFDALVECHSNEIYFCGVSLARSILAGSLPRGLRTP